MKVQINWNTVLKYGLILFIITVVCTFLLALTNQVTEPVIAQRNEEANMEAQKKVLPDAQTFEEVDNIDEIKQSLDENADIVQSLDVGYSGQDLVGYAVKTTPKGYGGEIELLTGISAEGEVTGISVIEQSETAGLGAKSTTSEFQNQFDDLSAEKDVTVVKGEPGNKQDNTVEAISGATITTNAVVKGVNTSQEVVKAAEATDEEL